MIEAPVSLPSSNLKITRRNVEAIRAAWIAAVEELIRNATWWVSDEPTWRVTQETKTITEEPLGEFNLPLLRIETEGNDYLMLEPIARQSWRGNGEVVLWNFPTYLRVRLMRDEAANRWIVRTESGMNWPFLLDQEVFLDVAKRLLDAP